MNKNQKNKPVPIIFQFIMIVITSLTISACLYRSFRYFSTNEPEVTVQKVTPALLEKFGGHPGIITAGLTISDFLIFDPVKNDFTFIGVLWFEYDPTMITLDLLGKFMFQRAEILEKSEPDTRIVNDKFIVRYTVKIHFKSQLLYQSFPLDNHRVSLQLFNPYIATSDAIFESVASNFSIKAATTALGWTLINKEVSTGFISAEGKMGQGQTKLYYPVILFSLEYLRSGIRYAFTILLPLLAIFFISLFSFSLDPTRYATLAITLTAGSVTALLAYRFVIENMSPAVGYFTMSDYIFFLFLCMVSIVFIFSMILKNIPRFIKVILVFTLHLTVCLVLLYLMLFWMHS